MGEGKKAGFWFLTHWVAAWKVFKEMPPTDESEVGLNLSLSLKLLFSFEKHPLLSQESS